MGRSCEALTNDRKHLIQTFKVFIEMSFILPGCKKSSYEGVLFHDKTCLTIKEIFCTSGGSIKSHFAKI